MGPMLHQQQQQQQLLLQEHQHQLNRVETINSVIATKAKPITTTTITTTAVEKHTKATTTSPIAVKGSKDGILCKNDVFTVNRNRQQQQLLLQKQVEQHGQQQQQLAHLQKCETIDKNCRLKRCRIKANNTNINNNNCNIINNKRQQVHISSKEIIAMEATNSLSSKTILSSSSSSSCLSSMLLSSAFSTTITTPTILETSLSSNEYCDSSLPLCNKIETTPSSSFISNSLSLLSSLSSKYQSTYSSELSGLLSCQQQYQQRKELSSLQILQNISPRKIEIDDSLTPVNFSNNNIINNNIKIKNNISLKIVSKHQHQQLSSTINNNNIAGTGVVASSTIQTYNQQQQQQKQQQQQPQKQQHQQQCTIKSRRGHQCRRRRGRLRFYYCINEIWKNIFCRSSLLSLLLSSPMASLSKFYRYMIVLMSKRLASHIIWIIGLSVAISVLPINLVNATPSSLSSLSNSEEIIYDTSNDDLNINENESPSYENETLPSNGTIKTPLFPTDLFSKEQLENGAVILHIIGVIYMFVALAIVCDEFFVPSLDVIIEKLGITDDVAGATFMAAGGSAPELFTSVIGVFVSFDDVGIGTIVGSAVFNILFVIGMCALFSKTVLTLTWWPLFRDCSFYSVSLLILIYFFRDNLIYWWEALVLFFIYIAYVGFMKWNQQMERCVKKVVYKNKVTRVRSTDQLMPAGNAANSSETSMATQPGGSVTSRAASESRSGPSSGAGNSSTNANSTVTGAKFRHGLLQLMIHTIDPLHDDDVPGKVDEKATQLHAIASLKVLLDATKPQRGAATTSAANHVKINLKETTLASDRPNGNIDTTLDSPSVGGRRASWIEQRCKLQTRRFSTKGPELDDEPEALSMSWPATGRKRITYLLVAPIVFPLWLTLPDTRTPRGKRFFPVTFIGSIVWIAAYSYLMVWWANVAGDTARIPPEVMGLTFLAAGTSIPDLITSVIVARKGFGDMAVSSSVGSNIFDVTVGLPIPWLLYGLIYQQPVEVNSVGMVCSITILFMMLLFVVLSIACFRWRMNKGLGFTMFLLYFVFVAVSLMFEYKIIMCPV